MQLPVPTSTVARIDEASGGSGVFLDVTAITGRDTLSVDIVRATSASGSVNIRVNDGIKTTVSNGVATQTSINMTANLQTITAAGDVVFNSSQTSTGSVDYVLGGIITAGVNNTVAFRTTDGGEIRDGHTGTDHIGGSALLIAGDGIGTPVIQSIWKSIGWKVTRASAACSLSTSADSQLVASAVLWAFVAAAIEHSIFLV